MATSAQLAHTQLEPWDEGTGGILVPRAGGRLRGKLGLGMLGLGMLLFGGFPYWAARRVMYPGNQSTVPVATPGTLDLDMPGVMAERVQFAARDGGRLSGWFVPGPGTSRKPWPCILLVYGYAGYKEQMAYYAKIVHEAGFASFMFDMQGSGLRRGRPVTLGYKEKWDLMDAVRYVRGRSDIDGERLGALGISMGAATALLAAEDDPHIKAIVADSSYATVADMIQPGLRAFVGSPATIFAPMIVWFAELMMGVKATEITPELSARKLGNRPVLVIHGSDDVLTDPQSAHRIHAALTGPKELWIVPNCGHARGPEVAYDEYRQRVNDFFKRTLLPSEPATGEVV